MDTGSRAVISVHPGLRITRLSHLCQDKITLTGHVPPLDGDWIRKEAADWWALLSPPIGLSLVVQHTRLAPCTASSSPKSELCCTDTARF